MNRIEHLDGFRGLAILMVFFYHAYARWNDLLGYSDAIGDGSVVQHFHLGVQLFFLISGFVILLSLQSTKGFIPFMYRRWLRLFPAMLICTIIIVLTAGIFDEKTAGDRSWTAILPGLIFVDPYVLTQITGIEFSNLDGPFWSIYVEMKFYMFAVLFYLGLGSKRMVHAILACYLAWLLGGYLQDITGLRIIQLGHSVLENLDFQYFGWFAAGAAIFVGFKEKQTKWFVYGGAIAIAVSVLELHENLPALSIMMIVIAVFIASMIFQRLQQLLAARWLLWFGLISYPLYLLHENILVSATITLSGVFPKVSPLIWPFVMLCFLSGFAYLVTRFVEPLLKKLLVLITSKPVQFFS